MCRGRCCELPKCRGRVPVNWAVIRGETVPGATLHYMTEHPDAVDIADQLPVPILADDTAFESLGKVSIAAEVVMWRSVPAWYAAMHGVYRRIQVKRPTSVM